MFDITSLVANDTDTLVSCNWSFTTNDGTAEGTHVFALPAGDAQLNQLSKADLLGWLQDQLGSESFCNSLTEILKNRKATEEAAAKLRSVEVPD
jgi:putative intracellular protease/amidase